MSRVCWYSWLANRCRAMCSVAADPASRKHRPASPLISDGVHGPGLPSRRGNIHPDLGSPAIPSPAGTNGLAGNPRPPPPFLAFPAPHSPRRPAGSHPPPPPPQAHPLPPHPPPPPPPPPP